MLDSRSLDVISRFKQAVLTRKASDTVPFGLDFDNRDAKKNLSSITSSSINNDNGLTPKVVEYNGSSRLVLTNSAIERSNYRQKRKWFDSFGPNVSEHLLNGDNATTNTSNGSNKSNNNKKVKKPDEIENEPEILTQQEEEFQLEQQEQQEEYPEELDSDQESNPFRNLDITEILAPLYHPLEIISHRAILKTYELPIFSQLASELIHLIEIEQVNLNWLNKMLQVLNGEDWYYLLEQNMGLPKYDHGLDQIDQDQDLSSKDNKDEGSPKSSGNGQSNGESSSGLVSGDLKSEQDVANGKRITRNTSEEEQQEVTDPFFALPKTLQMYEALQSQQLDEKIDDELANIKEDLVNYLQVSIQRLHEYIKNLTQIRNGLVRSDRLKQDLRKWAKEMYDKNSS